MEGKKTDPERKKRRANQHHTADSGLSGEDVSQHIELWSKSQEIDRESSILVRHMQLQKCLPAFL
jgi:hypothetical protein